MTKKITPVDLTHLEGALPTVSIVICTHKRPTSLVRLIGCLEEQKHTDFAEIELIVINDGSHDRLYEQINWERLPFFSTLYVPMARRTDDRPQLYKCKNIAVNEAKNEIVWLLDDDLIIDDHTLFIHRLYHHLLPNCRLVVRPHDANPQDSVHYQAPFPFVPQNWSWDKIRNYPSFAGISLAKSLWNEVGGLDEDYDGAMGFADLDLGMRLWQVGANITQVDGCTIFIDDRETGSHRDRYVHWGDRQHRNGNLFMEKWGEEESAKYGITK